MKLNITDRINITGIIPAKGNMITQTLVKDIISKVEFTQDAIKEFELKQIQTANGGSAFTWNKDKTENLEFDIQFTEAELDILKKEVKELDKKEEITQGILPTCKKINDAEVKTDEDS